ncbi:MAG: glycosyltransferase [bacterium]
MFFILLLLSFLYAVTLWFLGRGLHRLAPGRNEKEPSVSIIVAARNEEFHIAACLQALVNQTYLADKFEIVVIDDRSEDRTPEIVAQIAARQPRIKLLKITESSPHIAPKKRALDLGIRQAHGEIIFTTDADCTPSPEWLSEMVKYFELEVGMVAGYNPYRMENKTVLNEMLQLDYFAMACVAAAAAGHNYPLSCSGGNLAYRKKLYLELDGFAARRGLVSGDDDLFLEQVRDKTEWKIRFAAHPGTFVPTAPPATFLEFVHQRIRYASKGLHYSLPTRWTLMTLFLMNSLLALGFVSLLFLPELFSLWLAAYFIKSLAEFGFLKNGQKVFQIKFRTATFLFASFVHPFYIVSAAILGQFARFLWKGQSFRTTVHETQLQKIAKQNVR